jgi:serine/threonine protein kinase
MSRFVALKITKASAEASNYTELSMYHLLKNQGQDDRGAQYVVTLLDNFHINGPNGSHICLVLEPMGPNIRTMVERLPYNQSLTPGQRLRCPKQLAKRILKHMLSGLAFLHKHRIVHGDLHPANILFDIPSMASVDVQTSKLVQDDATSFRVLVRLDGNLDPNAPRYLVPPKPLHDFVDFETTNARISDLGSGRCHLYRLAPMLD